MKTRFLLAAVLLLAAGAVFAADQMSVTVKQTEVRATPSALGKVLGVLYYLDKVTILDQARASEGWLKVRTADGKLQGWVRISALTKKEIAMSAGSETAAQTASSKDAALATKGFTEEVEKEYRQENQLDYTWVDRMEQITITTDQVAAFIAKGGLASPEGGSQ